MLNEAYESGCSAADMRFRICFLGADVIVVESKQGCIPHQDFAKAETMRKSGGSECRDFDFLTLENRQGFLGNMNTCPRVTKLRAYGDRSHTQTQLLRIRSLVARIKANRCA